MIPKRYLVLPPIIYQQHPYLISYYSEHEYFGKPLDHYHIHHVESLQAPQTSKVIQSFGRFKGRQDIFHETGKIKVGKEDHDFSTKNLHLKGLRISDQISVLSYLLGACRNLQSLSVDFYNLKKVTD